MSRSEQGESLEEENRQVHQTNNTTIAHLQELETTSAQLQVIPTKLVLFFYSSLVFLSYSECGIVME